MTEEKKEEAIPQEQPETESHTEVALSYAGPGDVLTREGKTEARLPVNRRRDPVRLDGKILDPLAFREAMGTLYRVVKSDYRYVPKDRTAYLAYSRLRRQSADANVWQARMAWFDWLRRNDPTAWLLLDPVVSVHPDEIALEVFGKDEGTYARLALAHSLFELNGKPVCGTTNIDFSENLFQGIEQMRGYRETRLDIGADAVKVTVKEAGTVLEKKIRVPDSWLRGFLQVQSAAMLPNNRFEIAPIDLYNVLRHLRLNADQKRKKRGLRVELIPGEFPRMVLEPWETVIESTAKPYVGKMARIVRIWGRRRLMLLRRFLHLAERIEVHVLGTGLPNYWILRAGEMTFTLGLTGFTAADWSRATFFDLMLPRKTMALEAAQKVEDRLEKTWFGTAEDIGKATELSGQKLVEALQAGCQRGRIMYDIAKEVYRLRPLMETDPDPARLEFRNHRERIAHDLISRKGAVKIASENRIFGTGLALTGIVDVAEDKREYRPTLLISEAGHVAKAECTCAFFRKQGLKQGPCPHLTALHLLHAGQIEKQMRSEAGRKTIRMETRTFSKRDKKGEAVFQVTLDQRRLKIRWGESGQSMRMQTLQFNSINEARGAYFERLADLDARGYLDATAG